MASKGPIQGINGSSEILPFFGVIYKKRTIAIRRDPDYNATIRSITKAFPALAKTPASCIIISAEFSEYGGVSMEIGRDLWIDVLPKLTIVEVSIAEELAEEEDEEQPEPPPVELNNLAISHAINIEVQSGLKTYPLTLPGDSTVRYLKSLIQKEIPLQTTRLLSSTQGFSVLDDNKTLRDYNIKAQSLVTVLTNIRVYVTAPRRSKMPIMATLYANVSSLRLVVSNRTDVLYPECSLQCGGELLDDSKRLDSYAQIVPDCEIVVQRREGDWFLSMKLAALRSSEGIYFLKQITLRVQPDWAQDEDEEYTIYPKTTVLDLKTLLYNINIISPDRQILTFEGKELEDKQVIQEQDIQNRDRLMMKLYSGNAKGRSEEGENSD
ncbi:hypothetical protein FRC09_002243 [Ceratobasidium sp. 395]|nr:hypothetical protein FRC09_002243 [Ceratobasidium sp. 395]